MAKCSFSQVQISGIVACAPSQEKCIDDEIALFGGNVQQVERLKRTIGLNRRRVVESGTTAADLCESAARQLFVSLNLTTEAIDAVLFVTQTPDYPQPCNAAVLHGRLDLAKRCAALDVNLGCSGYVYGLWLAHMMVGGGGCKNVLLLAGDTVSQVVNPRDRSVAALFGDGGSATLIQASQQENTAWFSLGTDGKGFDKLIVPAGGSRTPCSDETKIEREDKAGNARSAENLFMDGAEIFNFSISEEPKSVQDLVHYAGLDSDSIDHFVFHQANRYILRNIAKRLKIDFEKVPMQTVERFGNQSSASIPFALCGELQKELTGSDNKRVLLSGFGVGLSWASAIVDIGKLLACELVEHRTSDTEL